MYGNKFIIACFASVFLCQAATAQPPSDLGKKIDEQKCIYIPRLTNEQLLNRYPYKLAHSVRILSYRHEFDDNYPIIGDSIINGRILESRLLQRDQFPGLADLLFNHSPRKNSAVATRYNCFTPRNAIAFLDSSDRVIDAYLVSFECEKIIFLKSKLPVFKDTVCTQMSEMLQSWFQTNGIYYGTDPLRNEYPGEKYGDRPIEVLPLKEKG